MSSLIAAGDHPTVTLNLVDDRYELDESDILVPATMLLCEICMI